MLGSIKGRMEAERQKKMKNEGKTSIEREKNLTERGGKKSEKRKRRRRRKKEER
jgi:hypothetical protein